MDGVLVVSDVMQWVLILLLGGVSWALARQIGLIYRRIPPVGAREGTHGPAAGESCPPLHATAIDGRHVHLGTENGRRTLIAFVSSTCSVCRDVVPAIRTFARSEASVMDTIVVSMSDEAATRSFLDENHLNGIPVVASREIAEKFGVSSAPYGMTVDEGGVVRATGLVNHFEHLESLVNALDVEQMPTPDQELLVLETGTAKGGGS